VDVKEGDGSWRKVTNEDFAEMAAAEAAAARELKDKAKDRSLLLVVVPDGAGGGAAPLAGVVEYVLSHDGQNSYYVPAAARSALGLAESTQHITTGALLQRVRDSAGGRLSLQRIKVVAGAAAGAAHVWEAVDVSDVLAELAAAEAAAARELKDKAKDRSLLLVVVPDGAGGGAAPLAGVVEYVLSHNGQNSYYVPAAARSALGLAESTQHITTGALLQRVRDSAGGRLSLQRIKVVAGAAAGAAHVWEAVDVGAELAELAAAEAAAQATKTAAQAAAARELKDKAKDRSLLLVVVPDGAGGGAAPLAGVVEYVLSHNGQNSYYVPAAARSALGLAESTQYITTGVLLQRVRDSAGGCLSLQRIKVVAGAAAGAANVWEAVNDGDELAELAAAETAAQATKTAAEEAVEQAATAQELKDKAKDRSLLLVVVPDGAGGGAAPLAGVVEYVLRPDGKWSYYVPVDARAILGLPQDTKTIRREAILQRVRDSAGGCLSLQRIKVVAGAAAGAANVWEAVNDGDELAELAAA
jgi:hypothetical protein